MTKMRKEKKSETLEVRLSHSRKEAFMAACEEQGITASQAVRTFIDTYLRQSRRMKLNRIAKELTMSLIRNPLKTSGGVAALATATIAAATFATLPGQADNTNLQPLSPPSNVRYPIDLAEQGISADCQAVFDVSEQGFVDGEIEIDCTHPGFVDAVRAAVRMLQFELRWKMESRCGRRASSTPSPSRSPRTPRPLPARKTKAVSAFAEDTFCRHPGRPQGGPGPRAAGDNIAVLGPGLPLRENRDDVFWRHEFTSIRIPYASPFWWNSP